MKKLIMVFALLLSACGSSNTTVAGDNMPKEWPWRGINMLSTSAVTELDRIESQRIKHVFLDVQPSRMPGGITDGLVWLNSALDRCESLELRCSVRYDDVPQTNNLFWADPAQQDAVLVQIETLVRGIGSRRVAHWQFLSEPSIKLANGNLAQPPEWPAFFERIRLLVRAIRPRDWLAYGPGPGGLPFGYSTQTKINDNRIIYNVHGFRPHPYTHQGIGTNVYGVTWPGIPFPNGELWNIDRLRQDYDAIRAFQTTHNVPVMVGSFSAVRWAPDAEDFLRDATEIFDDYGWSYAYWCYGSYNGWNPDYDTTYDPANYKQQYIGLHSVRWDTLRKILD